MKRMVLFACLCLPALAVYALTPASGLARHRPPAPHVRAHTAHVASHRAHGVHVRGQRAHAAQAPVVSTCCATVRAPSRLVLKGRLGPRGLVAYYRFQYGATRAYGSVTRRIRVPSGRVGVKARARPRRLAPGATYHFRLVAWNRHGITYGADARVRTAALAVVALHGRHRRASDATPPSAPGALTATPGNAQVALSWQRSSDNVGVAGYAVYRNGTSIARVSALTYTDTGVSNGTSYTYDVVAYDAAGNTSAPSNVVSATPAGPPSSPSLATTSTSITPSASTPPSSTPSASTPPSSTPSGYDQVVLADHPVGFWDMDHPGATEPDLSGNGHNGSYEGGTPALSAMPNGDQAADFNGSTEYMTVQSSSAFSIPTTSQFTWEGWIRPDLLQWSTLSDPQTYGYVDWMGKCEDYSPSCEWEARMYNSVNSEGRCNRLSAYVFNPGAGLGSGADWQPGCNLLGAGQWLYVVGEYQTQTTPSGCSSANPGTINIWVNGVEWNFSYHDPTGCMSQYGITPKAGSSPLDIGTMAMDTFFPGAVGKVALYNYLLGQPQINAHYDAMTGAMPSGSCANTCTIPVPTP